MPLLKGCTLQELSCGFLTQSDTTEAILERKRQKTSELMSNLIGGALQQQSVHVANGTGADM